MIGHEDSVDSTFIGKLIGIVVAIIIVASVLTPIILEIEDEDDGKEDMYVFMLNCFLIKGLKMKQQRKKNLEKAFKISSNVVEYKKIVLVDDIYTTGSTIDECAKVLMEAGVKEVFFISLSIGAGI